MTSLHTNSSKYLWGGPYLQKLTKIGMSGPCIVDISNDDNGMLLYK